MKDKIMSVTLGEITPEKLEEIGERLQDLKLVEVTTSSLKRVAEERKFAEQRFNEINTDAQIRAIRAYNLGFSKKEIADIFDMTTRQVTSWLGMKHWDSEASK
jgi:DNA-directed RNA polymerase specialized sigma24 family protein